MSESSATKSIVISAVAPQPAQQRNGPNIAYVRPEVDDLLTRWNLIRHCLAGEEVVKKEGDKYLPRPNATDTSEENKKRYEQYVLRAVFYNATARTHNGHVGQVFADDPKMELPTTLDPLIENVDGAGVPLEQQASKTLGKVLAFGRAALLADYPVVEKAATQKDIQEGLIRPTITLFDPWDVINWRTITVGGVVKLCLIVISESYVKNDDGFEEVYDDQWRVLRLDDQGLYVVEEWVRDPDNKQEFIIRTTEGKKHQYFPSDSKGIRLDYIPLTFVGSVNNDATPDLPPLYDLASLNIAHYRNSADYEEASYLCGQPTPVLSGLTEDWVKDVLKGAIYFGSRAAIMLPKEASAELLQAEPNMIPKEAMEAKEKQMVALGAKLVEQRSVQRTATEAAMDDASETSVLATVAENVSAAYRAVLKWALNFVDKADTTELIFELNKDFTLSSLDSATQAQIISAWQSKAIAFSEMRHVLRKAGIATLDDEAAKEEIENDPLNMPIEADPSLTGKGEDPNNPPQDKKPTDTKE